MKRLVLLTLCVVVSLIGISGNAGALLLDRGGGLIYDEDQDITWLQNSGYAVATGDARADTRMNWSQAVEWVDELEYYDSVRDVMLSDWRLPKTPDNPSVPLGLSTGINITTSEMGYMYYVNLGNQAGYQGLQNAGPFNYYSLTHWNLWSDATQLMGYAYLFAFDTGTQDKTQMASGQYGHLPWAVMDGDVAPVPEPVPAPVPEPATILLIGTGLVGFAVPRIRRKLKK